MGVILIDATRSFLPMAGLLFFRSNLGNNPETRTVWRKPADDFDYLEDFSYLRDGNTEKGEILTGHIV